MSLSCCTYASDVQKLELPFREVIESTLPIADEIIIINSDTSNGIDSLGENFESSVQRTIYKLKNKIDYNKLKMYHIPFPKRLRKNCYVLQRSNAIAQATKDWILLLDGDEVLNNEDYDKIYQAMELGDKEGYIAFTFKVLHHYRDYRHINTSEWYYKRRPYLFRNNLGIFDGYRSWMENGKIVTDYTSDLTTWDYKPLMDYAKHTSIRIHHMGYVRSDECMLNKYNEMETWFHDDNYSQKSKWEWNMNECEVYDGTLPKVLDELVEEHKKLHPNYYKE